MKDRDARSLELPAMSEAKLEAMEEALAAVGKRLASERRWEDIAPRVHRRLRKPYRDLAMVLAFVIGLGVWGLWERSAGVAALVVLGLFVPTVVHAALHRRRALVRRDRDLFAIHAREVDKRFQAQVMLVLFGVPLVLVLLVFAIALPDPRLPLTLAAALVVYLPVHVFVRLRCTLRELSEAKRWSEVARDLPAAPSVAAGTTREAPLWRRSVRKGVGILVLASVAACLATRVLHWAFDLDLRVPETVLWTIVVAWVAARMLVEEDGDEKAPARLEGEEDVGDGEEPEEEADDDDDDDDGESALALSIGLLVGWFQLFVLYLSPLVVLVLLAGALAVEDPTRPLVAAGTLAVMWIVFWKFVLPEGDDEEGRT